MTRPDPPAGAPRDAEGAVFAEPWEAQVFALAVGLAERGCFTWKEWTEALAAEIAAEGKQGAADDGSRYYRLWLAALEGLVTRKGLTDPRSLVVRKERWEAAYRETPHGKPVTLEHGR